MNAQEIISHKLGPLPLGIWVVIGAAGVGILYFMYGRSAGGSAPATTPIGSPVSSNADPLTLALEDLSASIGQIGSNGAANPGPVPPGNLFPNLGGQSIWLHTAPDQGSPVGAIIGPTESLTGAGNAVQGGSYTSPQLGVTSDLWVPVTWQGTTLWAFAPEVSGTQVQPHNG